MRIGPASTTPSNLTIALIERDRARRARGGDCSLRSPLAVRVSIARECQLTPDTVPTTRSRGEVTEDGLRRLEAAEVHPPHDPHKPDEPRGRQSRPSHAIAYNAQKLPQL